MQLLAPLFLVVAAALTPTRTWYPPEMPLTVTVKAEGDSRLVLTDFLGTNIDGKEGADVAAGEATRDLRQVFPKVADPGTYLLYVVPKGKNLPEFTGTPLVVSVKEDKRRGAPPGPMVVKVEPLRYAVMTTKGGPITMAFYYDVAPNTVTSFLTLAEQGYFNGLTFHRIVPGFVIQGGDPRGQDPNPDNRGTGGPGYQIAAEFNDRPHEEGVLSMARNGDPMEQTGAMPRSEYANSAGSQFFVCLDYSRTQALDKKYTAFGRVTAGMEAVKAVAAAPLADAERGRPRDPQVIDRVEVRPVTAADNPYPALVKGVKKPGQ